MQKKVEQKQNFDEIKFLLSMNKEKKHTYKELEEFRTSSYGIS